MDRIPAIEEHDFPHSVRYVPRQRIPADGGTQIDDPARGGLHGRNGHATQRIGDGQRMLETGRTAYFELLHFEQFARIPGIFPQQSAAGRTAREIDVVVHDQLLSEPLRDPEHLLVPVEILPAQISRLACPGRACRSDAVLRAKRAARSRRRSRPDFSRLRFAGRSRRSSTVRSDARKAPDGIRRRDRRKSPAASRRAWPRSAAAPPGRESMHVGKSSYSVRVHSVIGSREKIRNVPGIRTERTASRQSKPFVPPGNRERFFALP